MGDTFPIPRIDEISDQLGRSRYYSTLDLASEYHQVPIRPEDRQKTAFSTALRIYTDAIWVDWSTQYFSAFNEFSLNWNQ